jgi:hypothetical protein
MTTGLIPLAEIPAPCAAGCEHPLTVHSADLGCWLCDCVYGREAAAKASIVRPVPFDYQSEEVAEAFTEWCAAEGIEARDDQEYRWLRQAFTAGMNEFARYPEYDRSPGSA